MLFIHDHTFLQKDGETYTTGSLNQQIMNRYISWFKSVSVFATTRSVDLEKDKRFLISKNRVKNINFELVSKSFSPIRLCKYAKKIEKAVSQSDCVVVRMSIFGAIGVHYARKYKIPYLVEMVACPWDSLWYHSLKGKMLAPFMVYITRKVCLEATDVLYVTTKFLQGRYPTRGRSIACSDVELLSVNSDELTKRKSIISNQTDMKRLRLVTVANVDVKYKGQRFVIEALAALKERDFDYSYTLIGGGNSSELKALAKRLNVEEQVTFLGARPHEEIFDLIRQQDLYIQPSLQEGLPRAVIEAMSIGLPVVGSSAGGIPELIDETMVFKKGSVKNLSRVLLNLDKGKMLQESKKNFERSRNFETDVLNRKRSEFYEQFYSSSVEEV